MAVVSAEIVAPGSAIVGETIEVAWSGPDYRNDYVSVGEPDDARYVNYSYTREGTPLKLRMPPEPGSYEIRYVMNQDGKVLDRTAIEVADLSVTLVAPDTAPAGTTLEVAHDGSDYQNDLITITAVGADRYTTYVYANRGNPAKVAVPDEPGDYEIRYVMNQGSGIGAALTTKLTAQGYDVLSIARRPPPSAGSGRIHHMALDLTDSDAIPRVVSEVESAGRPVDLLVNNAGVQYSHCVTDPLEEDSSAALRTEIALNLEVRSG